jgi:glycosyltransferase involved in cell wall biosynthesis
MSYSPIRSEPAAHSAAFDQTSFSINKPLHRRSPASGRSGVRSKKERPGRPRTELRADTGAPDYPIIVHCHLCWDWVWQRPQQFMSRLSRRRPVLFIEMLPPDPGLAAPLARFRDVEGLPNLTLLTLQFPAWRWHDGRYVDAERRRLVRAFLEGPGAGRFENPVQWFYDPMVFPAFHGQMGEVLTVYDCMDELAKFQGAPPELREREQALLAAADVVFTGGRGLFEAKSRFNANCHFYGCGVDVQHFGRARLAATPLPPELQSLPRPILGYFGVVDERMDYGLLARLAEANRPGSVVLLGPVAKVPPAALPRRPNLHWLGQRPYSELPAYCKGFDVCLMPFALNEATRYINPTKALEYMAAGKPIVSTAVPDVVRNFGAVVHIGRNRRQFIHLCRRCARQPDLEAIRRGLALSQSQSWEAIVSRLEEHVWDALGRKGRAGFIQSRGAQPCASAELAA